MKQNRFLSSLIFGLLSFTALAQNPLCNAHAHSDYEHERPRRASIWLSLSGGRCLVTEIKSHSFIAAVVSRTFSCMRAQL